MVKLSFSSSSSFPIPSWKKYDVFLYFRYEERSQLDHGFPCRSASKPLHGEILSLVRGALNLENIQTLGLYENLEGEEIPPSQLVKALEESKLSVFIFSGTYASNIWCSNELIHILKWQRETRQSVVPIFYHLIKTSDVRKQQESYEAAFSILEEQFKDQRDKLDQWKQSLTKALDQQRSGFKLVENIVKDILRSLNKESTANFKGLVGLDKPIKDIENLSCIGSSNTRIIGIFGSDGIGKTTLAKAVYNRLSSQFEGSYFLDNVREESEKEGLTCLQSKLFAKLFEEEVGSVGIPSSVSTFGKERLQSKKVLLVLDDVNYTNQFEILAREHNYFSIGSRVIVTTRDVQVLEDIGVDEAYHVIPLNDPEALQLFHMNAFRNNFPTTDDHVELSEWVVRCAKGIPLALKLLGSYLYNESRSGWKNITAKLKDAFDDLEILDLFRICYEGLDYEEKNIFLEIVCFFKGKDKKFVEKTLDRCGYSDAHARVDDLIACSLITINHHDQLWLHDLAQHMGWQIIYQQCIQELGNSNRSWASQVLYDFLRDNTQAENLKEICLRNHKRLAKIQAFSELQNTPYYLNFRSCSNFKRLVTLDLSRTSIRKVPSAIDHLSHLVKFNFENCKRLAALPISIHKLKSLVYIDLSGCLELKNFPIILEPVENLTDLKLDRTAIKGLHSSFTNLIRLERLSLKMCENLVLLPSSISCLNYLKELNICCCQKLKSLPQLPLSLENFNAKGCTSLEMVSTPRIEFTRGWDTCFQLRRGIFDFLNCIKLDQKARMNIMDEAQFRMWHMATSTSTDEEGQQNGMFELWCPGNQIPRWFSHQSAKSSLKVKLPPNWHSTNFLGFALCAVVEFEDCYIDDKLKFYFQFGLSKELQPPGIREDDSNFTWRYDPDGGDRIVNSDHVCLFYYQNKSSFRSAAEDSMIKATLDFYSDNSDCKVKRCGVHLLYAEDVPKISNVDLQDVGESSEITENKNVAKISDVPTQDVGELSDIKENEDVDFLKHVRGQQSGSDKGPHERLQASEQVLCSILMELREHTKQISGYLQTEINSPRAADQTTLLPRVVSPQSIVQKPDPPEEVVQSLCSQIGELQIQNNEILQNLATIMPTMPSGFLDLLFPKPSASTSDTRSLFQHEGVQPQVEVPEEVIQSLQSQMTELRDCNQQILQFLHKPETPPQRCSPPAPPVLATKHKAKRSYQAIERKDDETERNDFLKNTRSSPLTSLPMPQLFPKYKASEPESGKSEKKSSTTADYLIDPLWRKGKKRRHKSVENFESIITSINTPFPSLYLRPPSLSPQSPPPPRPSKKSETEKPYSAISEPPSPPPLKFYNDFARKESSGSSLELGRCKDSLFRGMSPLRVVFGGGQLLEPSNLDTQAIDFKFKAALNLEKEREIHPIKGLLTVQENRRRSMRWFLERRNKRLEERSNLTRLRTS